MVTSKTVRFGLAPRRRRGYVLREKNARWPGSRRALSGVGLTHVDLRYADGDIGGPAGPGGSRPMAPTDAMWHWFGAKFPTDQFVIFAFDGVPPSVADAVAMTLDRARSVPDLTVRIDEDRFGLRFPRWVTQGVDPTQCIEHDLPVSTWTGCLDAVDGLVAEQLNTHRHAWRLHVFTPVTGVPGVGDRRPWSSSRSRTLSAMDRGPRRWRRRCWAVTPCPPSCRPARPARRSGAWRRRCDRNAAWPATWRPAGPARGRVGACAQPQRPAGREDRRPDAGASRRSAVGPTLTVSALAAVSDALTGYLRSGVRTCPS